MIEIIKETSVKENQVKMYNDIIDILNGNDEDECLEVVLNIIIDTLRGINNKEPAFAKAIISAMTMLLEDEFGKEIKH